MFEIIAKLRKRIHEGEGGFTLVEVLAALMILSTAIVTLAYTASIGFSHSARARQEQAATQIANRAVELMEALDKDRLIEGLYANDTFTGDSHIVSGVCETADGVDMPCDGENLVLDGPNTEPLYPYRKLDQTDANSGLTFDLYQYVTDAGSNLIRLTVLVQYVDNEGDTISIVDSSLFETVSGVSVGTGSTELLDATGEISGGQYAVTGILCTSCGTLESANIKNPALAGSLVSDPASASASAKTSETSMTISGATSTCGGVTASSGTPADTYCDGSAANSLLGIVTAPTTTPTTVTYLNVRKNAKDGPSSDAVVSTIDGADGDYDGVCDSTEDEGACTYAADSVTGRGTSQASREENVTVNLRPSSGWKGECDLVRTYEPNLGGSTSAVTIDQDKSVTDNFVTVTTQRKLPVTAFGCFPQAPTVGTLSAAVSGGGSTQMGSVSSSQTGQVDTQIGTTLTSLATSTSTVGSVSSDPGAGTFASSVASTPASGTFNPTCTTNLAIANNTNMWVAGSDTSNSERFRLSSGTCTTAGAAVTFNQRGLSPGNAAQSHAAGSTFFREIGSQVTIDVQNPVASGTVVQVGTEYMKITACSPSCSSLGTVTYTVNRGTDASGNTGSTSGTKVYKHSTAETMKTLSNFTPTYVKVNKTDATTVTTGSTIKIDSESMIVTALNPTTCTTGTCTYQVSRTSPADHSIGAPVKVTTTASTTLNATVTTAVASGTVVTIGSEQEQIVACSPSCTATGSVMYSVTRGYNSTSKDAHTAGTAIYYDAPAPTSVSVTVTGSAPSTNGVIVVDSEQMQVTNLNGCTTGTCSWTVSRGYNGTTKAAHVAASIVTNQWMPTSYSYNGTAATWNSTMLNSFNNGMDNSDVSGWPGGGFLIRYKNVVETIEVQAGVGASAPTYTRTGTVEYWNGTGYTSVDLAATQSSNDVSITLPQLKWSDSGTSMCLGAEETSSGTAGVPTAGYAFTIGTGSVDSDGATPIDSAEGSGPGNIMPDWLYLHMANTTTCTATNASNTVAHLYTSPVTGTNFSAEASYELV